MQSNSEQKAIGHRRRPSVGKSMPVTSILLNFPTSLSNKKYEGSDGTSPSENMEKPPMFFQINDKQFENSENCKEIIAENQNIEKNIFPPCLTCSPSAPPPPPPSTPIDYNTSNLLVEKGIQPLKILCEKLCNDDCKKNATPAITSENNFTELENFGKSFKKMTNKKKLIHSNSSSKLDLERKKFLEKMLNETEEDNHDETTDDAVVVAAAATSVVNEADVMLNEFRKKIMIEKTSMMTSPAARRRLAARKIEMELDNKQRSGCCNDDMDYIPPRELLLYLVRMGSFNSAPKINNVDAQDDNLMLPQGLTTGDLIQYCKHLRGENRPQLLTRNFLKPATAVQNNGNNNCTSDLTEELRVFHINAISKVCSPLVTSPKHLRILQWNVLSQSLGQSNDNFVCCPDEALTWENRKFLIVEEILQNNPDIICLQEVDHFKFLENILGSQGYSGIFYPKPDSPCLYIEENNGPDGCAIFFKRDKFELINSATRILEVWHVQSNQVAIFTNLRIRETDKEFTVCTTHLKARHGALLSKLRNEQGKDLLKFLTEFSENRPILLCGDFNAEPIEPVYSTVLNNKSLSLSSAYADINININEEKIESNKNEKIIENNDKKTELNVADELAHKEPPYTTWKIREDGEVCHTIDYVFYSKNHFKVNNCLLFPLGDEIGKDRTPSFQYPSDHFSLVCDFEILDNQKKIPPEE